MHVMDSKLQRKHRFRNLNELTDICFHGKMQKKLLEEDWIGTTIGIVVSIMIC